MADSKKSKLFKKYLLRMDTIKKDKYASGLFDALSKGKNSYMRIDRLESSNFDMVWINRIEDCIYEIGDIISNPREVTKTVTNIVPVELAKKIGAESVMHLASHTQYIKEIDENGDVVPNKILNMGSEEDIHTYENRFIATLIRRLTLFVEKRYDFVKKFAHLHDEEILYYKTKAIVDGSEVEIETKIKVRSESETEAANISNSYVDRIMKIREYVKYFYGSKFMKDFKTERDVRNPIVMTNILRKNPKYHKCYELFRFIEKYDKLGVSYKLDEDASIFNDEELAELNTVMFTNYLALKGKDRSKETKGFSKEYKPRILTSIDDEQFVYGDLLKGPIEFVRVDEGYQAYLDSLIKKDLPPRPTKIEKEYYQEEIAAKATRKTERDAVEKLLKRKKKEAADFDKRAKAMIALREKEERERLAREAELARLEEERRIEAVRQGLIRDALSHESELPKPEPEPVEEPAPVIEEPVEEVAPVEEPINEQPVQEEVQTEEPIVEEIPAEEPQEIVEEPVVEETPAEEVAPIEEAAPEEIPAEEPQPEPQPEEVQVAEEPVVEAEPVVEEPVTQEAEPVEEQPAPAEEVIIDENAEEEVEVVEEPAPVEETPVEEPQSSEDLDAIRAQLISDALNEDLEEPQPEPQPVEEVAPIEEEPISEEPVVEPVEEPQEEQPAPVEEEPVVVKVRKPRKPRQKKVKPVPEVVEEAAPVEEVAPIEEAPAPIEEPVIEEPQNEEPQEEEKVPENSEIPAKQPGSAKKKREKKPKKEKKARKEREEEPSLEPIPGRFIVKTVEGYYVSRNRYSVYKHDARVFDDFNEANKIKKEFGGKVVKL